MASPSRSDIVTVGNVSAQTQHDTAIFNDQANCALCQLEVRRPALQQFVALIMSIINAPLRFGRFHRRCYRVGQKLWYCDVATSSQNRIRA